MLYNKNRFKKVNAKKILHKVKKQWVTISIALLGLLGVKSVATHVNVNADVTSANNNQANHQLKSDQLQSGSSTLVQSNGASLTSASTNSASSVAAPSASVSASSNNTRASQGNRYQLNVSSAARVNSGSASLNVPSAAEKIHNDVLSDYAQKAQSDYAPANNLGLAKMVHHMLGETPQTPKANTDNSIMGQLMDIMHNNIQSGASEKAAKSAYGDLMNIISPSNLAYMSKNPIDGSTWYSYLTNFQNDLTTINGNGNSNPIITKVLNKLNKLENTPILGYTLKNNASSLVSMVPSYSLNDLAVRFDTPGGLAHGALQSVIRDESKLDQIGTAMRIVGNISNNQTLKNTYSSAVNDLTKLPSQTKAQQANTLSDLSNHISAFASEVSKNSSKGSNFLPRQDKQYLSGITSDLTKAGHTLSYEAAPIKKTANKPEAPNKSNNSAGNNSKKSKVTSNKGDKIPSKVDKKTSTKSQTKNNGNKPSKSTSKNTGQSTKKSTNTKPATNPSKTGKKTSVNTNATSAVNSVLGDIKASTLFNTATNILTNSNFAKRSAFSNLVNSAETDLANNKSASGFIQSFAAGLDTFGGTTASVVKNSLNNIYKDHSADLNTAYDFASANASESNGVDSLLNYMAGLNSGNAPAQLYDIHDAISNNSEFKGISSLSAIADNAATDANNIGANDANASSKADSTAYHNLLSNEEAPLFSAMVNRIVASGFNSGAFDNLVSSAETDLSQASNASDFIQSLTNQDGAFTGTTASMINHYLNSVASNSMLSSAYSEVSANPSAADSILNELSGMNSNNEISELDDIAQSAKSNFNNPTLFGSLASDASSMATSVSSSQAASNTANADESNAYQNFLKNDEGMLFSAVVNRITTSGFNSGAFTSLVNTAEGDLDSASTASDFVQSLSGQTNSFTGGLAHNLTSYMNSFANNPYVNSAYQAARSSSTYTKDVLSNLADMANSSGNKVSDLSNIASDASSYFSNASSFGSLASDASSMYKSVSNSASSANTKPASKGDNNGGKKTPAKPVNVDLSNLIYNGLENITSKDFDVTDFRTIVNNLINDNFITFSNTLSELWSYMNSPQYSKSFPNISHFKNDDVGKAIVSIMDNPTLVKKFSVAYSQIYGNTTQGTPNNSVNNIYKILNDFVSIASNKSTRKSALQNIVNTINGDSNIVRAINTNIDPNGVKTIDSNISDFENGKSSPTNSGKKSNSNNNKPKTPTKPNKKPSNDTNLVNKTINSSSIKILADHLASSKAPANLSDIINNLEALPNPKLSTMDFNGKLSKISDDLDNDKGSFIDVNKVNQVLNDINGNDANPTALDNYANKLSNPEKTLVKDFNAGIQYLKSHGQNADNDYNSVLNDLLDIKNNPSHEDHDLSHIAKTINKGKGNLKGLHVLKLFASASHQAAKKDYQPIKANNRKQQKQDGKRHASYMAAKIQQKKDAARHNQIKADKAQHNKDVARHKQILADKAQHDKDTQRHNHIENMSALAEANSAARAAATYYRKDSAAAASAQKFAKGLNPGSDSDLASHAASQASGYAGLAGTFESEAISADQQAKLDINKSGINNYVAVHTDAEMASDKANTTNYLFSGISDQLMNASTDATAAGYKSASNSGSTSSSSTSASGSTKSSSTSSSSVAPSSSSASTSSSSTSSSTQSSSTSSSSVAPSSSSSVPTSSSTTSYVPSSTVTPSYTPNVPSSTNYFPTSESTMPSSSVTFNSGYSEGSSVSSEVSSSASIEMTNDTDPDQLGIHQAMKSGKATIERVAPMNYWFDVSKTCLAHNHIGSVGKVKDYSLVLHTGDLAQLEKVFVVKQGKRTYYRYEVKFDGHNYYVTANAKFTRKAYCQPKDLKKARQHGRRGHRYYNAVVIMPCLTHRSVRYTNDNAIRPVLRNQVVKIKKIIKIGRKGYGMTRFELTDGTFITSNRDFIKLL